MAAKILVLEPEPVLVRLISLILWRAGYSVLGAATAEEAIWLCVGNNGSIRLLIADVITGDYTGLTTALLMRELWPDLAVLFTSTVPVESWPEVDRLKAAKVAGALFLGKPFEAAKLRKKVEALIGATALSEAVMPPGAVVA